MEKVKGTVSRVIDLIHDTFVYMFPPKNDMLTPEMKEILSDPKKYKEFKGAVDQLKRDPNSKPKIQLSHQRELTLTN